MKNLHSSDILMEWWQTPLPNRYLDKVLSAEKELEVDIDGTVYLHLIFDYSPAYWRMIKNYCDDHFATRGNRLGLDDDEFYYENSPVTILARDSKSLVVEMTCSDIELFNAFLKWDASITEVIGFFEKYVLPLSETNEDSEEF